jgi:hypothetical protein
MIVSSLLRVAGHIHDPGICPEVFEIIVRPALWLKKVNNHIDEVHNDPSCACVDIRPERRISGLRAKIGEFRSDGSHLAIARACADEYEIANLTQAAHIKQCDILAVSILKECRGSNPEG